MTISTSARKVVGVGNALTRDWQFNFLIPDQASLNVVYTDADGEDHDIAPGNYMVSGLNNPDGGYVTYPIVGAGDPIAVGAFLTVYRSVPYVQETDIQNQDNFNPEVLEGVFDYAMMAIQQLLEVTQRQISFPITEDISVVNMILPSVAQRGGGIIGFDEDGNLVVVDTSVGSIVGGMSSSSVIRQTMWIPAAAMFPSVSPYTSPATFAVQDTGEGAGRPQFVNVGLDLGQSAQFHVCMPDGWTLGNLTFRVKWMLAEEPTDGDVAAFSISAQAISGGEGFDTAFTTSADLEQAVGTPAINTLYDTGYSAGVTPAGAPAVGDMLAFLIERVAASENEIDVPVTIIGVTISYNTTVSDQ